MICFHFPDKRGILLKLILMKNFQKFVIIDSFHYVGYSPIFDESFEFQINLPELALVRFAVLDDDYIGDEFIGQYTIPFDCMQTGLYSLTFFRVEDFFTYEEICCNLAILSFLM